MCDLNGPFRLCSCGSEIDYNKPHWILHQNTTNAGDEIIACIGMMTPLDLIEKIERRKILRRLNTINVFDFEYSPKENDQLELNFSKYDGLKFTFQKGKWVLEEWYCEHPVFKHELKKEGEIDSVTSKLKEVYIRYLDIINEDEIDIVKCGWQNIRISEKKLIELLEKRIKGEKIELPEGYKSWGI